MLYRIRPLIVVSSQKPCQEQQENEFGGEWGVGMRCPLPSHHCHARHVRPYQQLCWMEWRRAPDVLLSTHTLVLSLTLMNKSPHGSPHFHGSGVEEERDPRGVSVKGTVHTHTYRGIVCDHNFSVCLFLQLSHWKWQVSVLKQMNGVFYTCMQVHCKKYFCLVFRLKYLQILNKTI